MGLRQRMGALVSTAFPSGHLALTPFHDLKDFKSRRPVPGRPHSFSPGVFGHPLGRSSRGLAQRVKLCPGERLKALSADSWSGRRASARGTQRSWRVGVGVADSGDGWLRPLGDGGGPGSPSG